MLLGQPRELGRCHEELGVWRATEHKKMAALTCCWYMLEMEKRAVKYYNAFICVTLYYVSERTCNLPYIQNDYAFLIPVFITNSLLSFLLSNSSSSYPGQRPNPNTNTKLFY